MLLCPLCAQTLQTVERQGIELDHCPDCGGFWLDQGELDSLVRQEAVSALLQGQEAMSAARHDREYDRTATPETDFIGEYREPHSGSNSGPTPRFGMARNAMERQIPLSAGPQR